MSPTSYQTAPPRGEAPKLAVTGHPRRMVPDGLGSAGPGPRGWGQVDLPVLLLVLLESGEDPVDLGRIVCRGSAGLLRVGGCAQVAQQAVGRLLGLHGVQLRLALLGGVLGRRRCLRGTFLHLVEK